MELGTIAGLLLLGGLYWIWWRQHHCPYCREQRSPHATICPHCHQPQR